MKINADALYKRAQKEFESSEPSDWDSIKEGEFYTYTEDDLLPHLGEYQEKLTDNRKNYSVTVPRFEFEQSTIDKLLEISSSASVSAPELFINRLRKNVQSELGRLELQLSNRNTKKQNNVIKKEMSSFHKQLSSLLNKYINMDSDLRAFIVQDMRLGLPYLFQGKLNDFSEDDVLRFLHLMETTTQYHEEALIDYSRTNSIIHFVQCVWETWGSFVNHSEKRGSKSLFFRLLNELSISMSLPEREFQYWEYWITKAQINTQI